MSLELEGESWARAINLGGLCIGCSWRENIDGIILRGLEEEETAREAKAMPSVTQKGPQEECASGRLAWSVTTDATGPRKADWSVSIRFVQTLDLF